MKRFNTDTGNLIPAFQQDWGATFDNIQEMAFAIFGSAFSVIRGLTYNTETEALTDGYVMMNGVLRYVPAGIPVGSYIVEDNVLSDARGGVYAYTLYNTKVSASATMYPQLTLVNIEKYRYRTPEKWDLPTGLETIVVGKTWNGRQVYGLKLQNTLNIGTYSWETNTYNIRDIIFATGQLYFKPMGAPFYRVPYSMADLSLTIDYLNHIKLSRTVADDAMDYDIYIEYTKI